MALGLAIDAWEPILSLLKDGELRRLYMTGDSRIMHVLRTAKFNVVCMLHKRVSACDLSELHSLFPRASSICLDRHSRCCDRMSPKTSFVIPRRTLPALRFNHVRRLHITFALPTWIYGGNNTRSFFAIFPGLETVRLKVHIVVDFNRLIRHLPATLLALHIDVKKKYGPHRVIDATFDTSELPANLLALDVTCRPGDYLRPSSDSPEWPRSLTRLCLPAVPTFDLVKSLPPMVEFISLRGDAPSLPYSAFPPSATRINIGRTVIELDNVFNPNLKILSARIQWLSASDLRRYALPLPSSLQCTDVKMLVALAMSSRDPVDFILNGLPPGIDLNEVATEAHGHEDVNGVLFNASAFKLHCPGMPPVPTGVDSDSWCDRFHYLTSRVSWSSPVKALQIGGVRHPAFDDFPRTDDAHFLDDQVVKAVLLKHRDTITNVLIGESFEDFDNEVATDVMEWLTSPNNIKTIVVQYFNAAVIARAFERAPMPNRTITSLNMRNTGRPPSEVFQLASMLPCLTKLSIFIGELSGEYDSVAGNEISFRCLEDGCPRLRKLSLSIDVDTRLIPQYYLDVDFASHLPRNLKSLTINAANVAYLEDKFDERVFPNLPRSMKTLVLELDYIFCKDYTVNHRLRPATLRRLDISTAV